MRIPTYLDRDDYLQNPIMRRFLKENKIDFVYTRTDYINAIENFSEKNEVNEQKVKNWLEAIVKEGSKEFCYKKVVGVTSEHKSKALLEAKINENYPDCPNTSLFDYRSTGNIELVNYRIISDENGDAEKVEFTFSSLVLYGDVGKIGDVTVLPFFVELYIKEGMIVGRIKAKSTVFQYDETNHMLLSDYKINTMDYVVLVMDRIIDILGLSADRDKKVVKEKNSRMMYRLYNEYSFTPIDIEDKIKSQKELNERYINALFDNLNLDAKNKETAISDLKIYVEKFISINGNMNDIFKNDRAAYLVKVAADDDLDLTSIDAASSLMVPLQTTEAFFDSKKAVIKGKKCKKIHMVFRREDETYFSNAPLLVQFGTIKNYGYFKTIKYAEEADIQNVLRAVFRHY